ncbi:Tubulin polyglutamylase TTLL5 [Echinococcus granulosus]|uniref:Tubulin--tyrosine ligase-like protein 5 n=1 Tax=Echinococcus granulosus TaxID=6210 RepID=W6UH41_ECHGR|nr:Tubulin polyglutamylase TTLL5 [Echinococcus granulosus]EUB60336.1 Tubulin polyglutamylase TTLL5 [Echinococcus granulosus]
MYNTIVDYDANIKPKGKSYNGLHSTDDGSGFQPCRIRRWHSKSRQRSNSLKSHRSEEFTKSYLFGPVLRHIKAESAWFAPLSPIPVRQPGLAWNGVYRRTPTLIFSPTVMMCKESSVKTLAEKFNLSFKLNRADCRLLRSMMQSHGFIEVNSLSSEFNLMWSNSHIKPTELRAMCDFQRVNHFPRSYELTRKDKLAQNIKRMQYLKGLSNFDIIPKTFVLPCDQIELRSSYLKGQGPYIVKPIASSRGRGIHIICNPDAINSTDQVIVSKYVSNPLLIDGFKFDLRLYVAVTSYCPLTIYIYEEGLVRFATVRYQKGSKHYKNLCMHLTNYSVNKKNRFFVHNDDADIEDFGNKWSLGALLRYLRGEGKDTAALMLRIEDIIIKAFIAVEDPINQACRLFMSSKFNCFELYGFDVIVDENLRPWLLEVNLSPSLACDTPLDFKVKSNMLSDLLNLAGIICYDPTKRCKKGACGTPNFTSPKHPTYFVSAQKYVNEESQNLLLIGKIQSKISSSSKEMTSEELQLVRRFQEETARCGGWLRIFPCGDTWMQYASLLHDNSQGEITDTPQPRWRFSMASAPTHTPTVATSGTIQRGGRRVNEDFLTHASATMAVLAMQKASSLRVGTMARNNDGEITLIHPNLVPPKVNIGMFTGLSSPGDNEPFASEVDEDNEEKLMVHMPPLQADDADSVLPIHSLTTNVLSEYLMIGLGFNLQASNVKREQANRVATCYSQTLGRLPFYHRKIGALPVCIRGVCLLAGCGHESGVPRLCGMRRNEENNISYDPHYVASTIENLPDTEHISRLYRREKGGVQIQSMTQYQARMTFSAYLSRIHSRFKAHVLADNKKQECVASKKADKQADLILRFLQKAALKLSPQAVKWFYSTNDNKFIQIYDHETTLSRVEEGSGEGDGSSDANFNQFIENATENELEVILSQYTRTFHSLSLFTRQPSKYVVLQMEQSEITSTHSRFEIQANSNKFQGRETPAPIEGFDDTLKETNESVGLGSHEIHDKFIGIVSPTSQFKSTENLHFRNEIKAEFITKHYKPIKHRTPAGDIQNLMSNPPSTGVTVTNMEHETMTKFAPNKAVNFGLLEDDFKGSFHDSKGSFNSKQSEGKNGSEFYYDGYRDHDYCTVERCKMQEKCACLFGFLHCSEADVFDISLLDEN